MTKLGLINYEGDCIYAVKTGSDYKMYDQWNTELAVWNHDEFTQFIEGFRWIEDSRGKSWNYLNESIEARPSIHRLMEFISSDHREEAKSQLIELLEGQVMDLVLMSKIELGDDVIAEIKRLKEIINE